MGHLCEGMPRAGQGHWRALIGRGEVARGR